MVVSRPVWIALAFFFVAHMAGWSWSLSTAFVRSLSSLVLASAASELSPEEVDSWTDRDWVYLICTEDAERVGDAFISRLQDTLPKAWRLASEGSPPSDVRVTRRECAGCTIVCTDPVFRSPVVSIVDTTWWGGSLAGAGYRHVGFHLGPWWLPVHTSLQWLS